MKFYLAPMEGITGQVYRNVYHSFYDNIDKYFTPFIAPTQKHIMRTRERKDVALENNQGMYVVPQILTNQVEHFCRTCEFLGELGYTEVNLNLGCPAATVVSKGKGAGFLDEPRKLDGFFEGVFDTFQRQGISSRMRVSVKTRLGLSFADEFPDILRIYNRYPLEEIIIHPRVQQDFYKNHPNLYGFREALSNSVHPVCYNGDIFTRQQYEQFTKKFPTVKRIMLGRGVIANPALVEEIRTGEKLTKERMKEYHDRLYAAYRKDLSGERDVLFKMKELWFYIGKLFEDADKAIKKVKKANKFMEYEVAVANLFDQCEIRTNYNRE